MLYRWVFKGSMFEVIVGKLDVERVKAVDLAELSK
jgi:hypothetical protein